GVARLGPRVRMKQIEEPQRTIGDSLEDLERVTAPQPDIGEMLVADMAKRGGNAVEERFGADEAVVRQHVGPRSEMLARAETDFEMQRAIIAKQALRGDLAILGHLDLRQQLVDQLLLALAQLVPARPAVEAVEG